MNDSHAYFDLHQEMFWQGDHAVYRPAGGYARIATIVKQIRAQSQGRILFCDCGDTMHGTYPALDTHGQALIPILNSLGLDAMTAHWEFAYCPKVFHQRVAELSYANRCLGLSDYFKIENPPGHRIQKLFAGDEEVQQGRYYTAAFVTPQGIPQKYGRNRENRSERIVDALRKYLASHYPFYAELRDTFVAV